METVTLVSHISHKHKIYKMSNGVMSSEDDVLITLFWDFSEDSLINFQQAFNNEEWEYEDVRKVFGISPKIKQKIRREVVTLTYQHIRHCISSIKKEQYGSVRSILKWLTKGIKEFSI